MITTITQGRQVGILLTALSDQGTMPSHTHMVKETLRGTPNATSMGHN